MLLDLELNVNHFYRISTDEKNLTIILPGVPSVGARHRGLTAAPWHELLSGTPPRAGDGRPVPGGRSPGCCSVMMPGSW